MRNFLKSSRRRLNAGWLWPLVLLALPGCLLDASAYPPDPVTPEFDPGPLPRTSAIMCEIPKPGTTQCATADEVENGVSTTRAAVALAEGDSRFFALDYSPNECPDGLPMRTELFGPYPDGLTVCLNCTTQIPDIYPDANKACIAKCKDLLNADEGSEPDGGVDAYCESNAKVAPNFNKSLCFPGACDSGGTPLSPPAFVDPRRFPEPVMWIVDPADGTAATDNSLTRIKPTTDTNSDAGFDAGSEAVQVIMTGDGWVEFGVGNDQIETQLSHVLGLSHCEFPCDSNSPPADFDPSLNDIEFSISLNKDGNVYVIENPGLVVQGPFGDPYGATDRFRVKVVDKHNGTAEISYSRLKGTCTIGTKCDEDVFFTSTTTAKYPLRIDTSFREENATLQSVTIVRIQ